VTEALLRPDRFELRGELGSGGMGVVYRVFDRDRGEEVALKTLRKRSGRDIYRFKREFRALAELAHPSLVTLHELFTVDDEWMYTMELVIGAPFDLAMRRGGPDAPLDLDWLRASLVQLTDGLEALHCARKLHRDLKPSNVLVEPGGRVVILDFGLVADVSLPWDRTHEQTAVGTPGYMSPEQAADRPLSAASDVYSFGTMLYEVLARCRPFSGSAYEVLRAKQVQDPPPLARIAPDAPGELATLCTMMLARDPASRPTPLEILTALDAAVSPWTRRIAEMRSPVRPGERVAEIAELHRALADSRDHGVLMIVVGPQGAGKTALLDAFAEELARTDTLVLRGRASAREAVRFRGFDSVVDHLAAFLVALDDEERAELAPAGLAAIARVFPALKRVPGADVPLLPGTERDPAALVAAGFEALRDLMVAVARHQPMVVMVDDTQWGSLAGARILTTVFQGARSPHCLIVAGHRQGPDGEELLDHLMTQREGDLRVLHLDRVPAVSSRLGKRPGS